MTWRKFSSFVINETRAGQPAQDLGTEGIQLDKHSSQTCISADGPTVSADLTSKSWPLHNDTLRLAHAFLVALIFSGI